MKNRLTRFYLWVYFPFMVRFVFPLTSLSNRLFSSFLKNIFIDRYSLESEVHFEEVCLNGRSFKIPSNFIYFIISLQRLEVFSFIKNLLLFVFFRIYLLLSQNNAFFYTREILSLFIINTNRFIIYLLSFLKIDIANKERNLFVDILLSLFYKSTSIFLYYASLIKKFSINKLRLKKRIDFQEIYYQFLEYVGFEIDESVKRKVTDITDADRKVRMVKFRSFPGLVNSNDFSAKDIASNKGNYGDFSVEDDRSKIRIRPDIKAKMTEAFNPFVNLYGEESEVEFYVSSVDSNMVSDMVKTDAIEIYHHFIFFSRFTTKFKFISIFLVYASSVLNFMIECINGFISSSIILYANDGEVNKPLNPIFDKMTSGMIMLKKSNHNPFRHSFALAFLTSCLFSVYLINIFCYDGYAYYGPSQLISSKAPFAPVFVGFTYLIYLIYYYFKPLTMDYLKIRSLHVQQVKYDEKEETQTNRVDYSMSALFTIILATYYTSFININSPHFLFRIDLLKRIKKMYRNNTTVYSDLLVSPMCETSSTLPDGFILAAKIFIEGQVIIYKELVEYLSKF